MWECRSAREIGLDGEKGRDFMASCIKFSSLIVMLFTGPPSLSL